jgi:Predicted site-specific integrase-resolvase
MGIVKRRKVVLYARVSNKRKDDLVNQVKYLEENVKDYEGDNRRGIRVEREEEGVPQLRMILNNEVSKAIAYPGRLVRFGFEILEEVCKAHDRELVVLNGEDKTPEQELIEDLISIRIVQGEIARSGESRVREGEEVRRRA